MQHSVAVSILDMGANIVALSLSLYVLLQEKSTRKSVDRLRPTMTEEYKNDPYI